MTIPCVWGAAGSCVPLEEFLRPDSDITTTGWTPSTGTNVYAVIDESSPSDTDYVSSNIASSICPTQDTTFFEVGLSNPSGTLNANCTGITVRVRAAKVETINTGDVDMTVELKQGATVRASQSFPNLTTSYVTKSFTLSFAEVKSITGTSDLRIRVTIDYCGNSDPHAIRGRVSWAEVELYAT